MPLIARIVRPVLFSHTHVKLRTDKVGRAEIGMYPPRFKERARFGVSARIHIQIVIFVVGDVLGVQGARPRFRVDLHGQRQSVFGNAQKGNFFRRRSVGQRKGKVLGLIPPLGKQNGLTVARL